MGRQMAEGAFFFYGILATFVIGSMKRNKEHGHANIKHLVFAGWGLLLVSIMAASYCSFTALNLALQA